MSVPTPALVLRPALSADTDFLFALFADARAAQFGGLDAAVLAPLLRMQFAAQRQHYARQFPGAVQAIIDDGGGPLGQCVVRRAREEIHLVDISVAGARRARGVGTALLRGLQAEAEVAGVPLRLMVAHGNRAGDLYRRLGFAVTAQDDMHSTLEWRAHPHQ